MIGQIAMTSKVKHRSCAYETTDTFNVFVFIYTSSIWWMQNRTKKNSYENEMYIADDVIGGKVLWWVARLRLARHGVCSCDRYRRLRSNLVLHTALNRQYIKRCVFAIFTFLSIWEYIGYGMNQRPLSPKRTNPITCWRLQHSGRIPQLSRSFLFSLYIYLFENCLSFFISCFPANHSFNWRCGP